MSVPDPTNTRPISDPLKVTSSRRLRLGCAVGFAAALGVFALGHARLWQSFELRTLDWRQQILATRTAAVDQVAIVLVDESSVELERRENSIRWPWPRDMYVPLLRFLDDAGAKAVAFDMILCDPGPAETDADFAAAVHESGKVTVALKLDAFPRETDVEAKAIEKASVDIEGWTFSPREGLARLVLPRPEIVKAVRGLGFVNVLPDPDGTIRRVDLATTYPHPGKEVSSLALDVTRTALGRDQPLEVEGRNILLGDRRIPLGRDGRALIRYYGGPETFRTEPASNVWRSFVEMEEGRPPLVSPDVFKDRIVIVGIHLAGLDDVVTAPMHPSFLGPELQATICANLLGGEFLLELAGWQRVAVLLVLGLVSGAAAFLAWRAIGAAAVLAAVAAAYSALAFLAFRLGLVLDLFGAWALLGSVFVAETIVAEIVVARRNSELRRRSGGASTAA